MVWPLIIGAAIGGIVGGMSGEDGWDWKRALMGAGMGAATGGAGAAALGGSSAGALAGGVGASSVGGSGAAGIAAIQSGGAATTASGLGAGIGSAAAPFDYGKLGQTITNMGEQQQEADSRQSGFESLPSGSPLTAMTSGEDNSIARDLDAERQSIYGFPQKTTSPGLGGISTAARGGIATKFGIMKTPSGSLTGGEIVGPGTGTSDTIRSAIYPDVASKLGASSSPVGRGHQVQNAALSDGEFVITAKAVEGVGKNAGAPPGQEREYGSKLLDQAMNQWQRI
jgi:hypothetical protein